GPPSCRTVDRQAPAAGRPRHSSASRRPRRRSGRRTRISGGRSLGGATCAAVDHVRPVSLPFLAPRERPDADGTGLGRQVLFLNSPHPSHLPPCTRGPASVGLYYARALGWIRSSRLLSAAPRERVGFGACRGALSRHEEEASEDRPRVFQSDHNTPVVKMKAVMASDHSAGNFSQPKRSATKTLPPMNTSSTANACLR